MSSSPLSDRYPVNSYKTPSLRVSRLAKQGSTRSQQGLDRNADLRPDEFR